MGPKSWRDILQASGEDVPAEGGNKEKVDKTKVVFSPMVQSGPIWTNDEWLWSSLELKSRIFESLFKVI